MPDRSFLGWPFFGAEHRHLHAELESWAAAELPELVNHNDIDGTCRRIVRALGKAGWLSEAVPEATHDVRSLCLARETLAAHEGLVDFAFAMQGLGTAPIVIFGSDELKARYLPPVRDGKAIAAFALSEPEAGSDVASLAMSATPDGPDHVRLDGEKTWISNGGIADHYVVFARSGEAPGARGLSAFMVDADAPGLSVAERIKVVAPHPLARLTFDGVRVPLTHRLGGRGEGFKVAMATLDVFRSSVGAAALGLARRAYDETLAHTTRRQMFGAPLADLQMTQASLAEMATAIDAAALLIYRAAWTKDAGAARVTREASMAKLFATEEAQKVIDRAVQLHGGHGVTVGNRVEALYRDIRALRIYEGASEIQKIVIARQALADFAAGRTEQRAAE